VIRLHPQFNRFDKPSEPHEKGGFPMQEKKERGAIVMEASIALTAFMFLILTLLQIVNIYYIQGRVGVALNAAAKDLSQYSFLYFKLGMNDVDAAMSADTDGSRQSAYNTIDNLCTLQSSITGLGTDASNMNFEGIRDGINNGIDAGSAIYDEFASQLADDHGRCRCRRPDDAGQHGFPQQRRRQRVES
jgi:hypothetical protein